jgi:hypothetical protein
VITFARDKHFGMVDTPERIKGNTAADRKAEKPRASSSSPSKGLLSVVLAYIQSCPAGQHIGYFSDKMLFKINTVFANNITCILITIMIVIL